MNIKEIQTVKIQGESFLINCNLSVPKVDGNRHYETLKEWLKTNIPEPEFTEEELLKQKQDDFRFERNILLDKVDKAINKAEDLLQDTTVLRAYRQALRDATKDWTMPESIL